MKPRELLHGVFQKVTDTAFEVDYWGETVEHYGEGPPVFTLVLKDARLSDFLTDDIQLAFGEAYMDGRIDIDGDLADLVALAIRNMSLSNSTPNILRMAVATTAGIAKRTLKRQREDVTHHYDLGNDFFELWLDESMTYSCGYFRTSEDTLEQAQKQKIDHCLRKLRLRLGESLLDIGSGWGSLAVRAADLYDVNVLGITLSEEQRRKAEETIRERGLEQWAKIRTEHYETLDSVAGTFDKIVSIGMIEHVGRPHLAGFVDAVQNLLRPGGLALLHLITSRETGPMNAWIDKYIFPGGYLPTLPELTGHLTEKGFRIWDVENLGPHYRLTLDRWSERFEQNVERITAMYDERFVRMWRLYLRGCSAAFREGTMDVHQILVSKGNVKSIPMTRDDLYVDRVRA